MIAFIKHYEKDTHSQPDLSETSEKPYHYHSHPKDLEENRFLYWMSVSMENEPMDRCPCLIAILRLLKGSLTGFSAHCSLRSLNRVCNIGWAENGPAAVVCPLMHPVK